MKSLKILVSVQGGLGDKIEATPLCHALHLLGHEVDLFLDSRRAEQARPLFSDWPVLTKLHTHISQIDFSIYDLGINTHGKSTAHKQFPIGLCAEVRFHDLFVHGLSDREANLRVARFLGYEGPVPPGHVEKSARKFELRPNTVVIHAGCNKASTWKRWEHWPEICRRLETAGYPVTIVGTDLDLSDENWEARHRTEFNLPLTDLVSLMSQATFYLGNDSGVGHVAAALGLPGLLLYGPTDPLYFSPNSEVLKTLSFAIPPARVHDHIAPSTLPLINMLGPEDVWREIERLLANPAKDPPRTLPPAERKYPPASSCPQFLDEPPETRVYKKVSHSLLSIFSASAKKLMEGQDRKTVAAEAAREAGKIHIGASFQLLKLYFSFKTRPSGWAEYKGLFHARRGIRAGYLLSGVLLYLAHEVISLFRRNK